MGLGVTQSQWLGSVRGLEHSDGIALLLDTSSTGTGQAAGRIDRSIVDIKVSALDEGL
jgi:hypothetical protein